MKILTNKEYQELIENQKEPEKKPLRKFKVTLSNGDDRIVEAEGWERRSNILCFEIDNEISAMFVDFKNVETLRAKAKA